MAVPSEFARKQYEALLAQEKTSQGRRTDLKAHFKKTIDNLRSTFTPKSNEMSNAQLELSTFERLPQTNAFQGGYKLAAMNTSSSSTFERFSKTTGFQGGHDLAAMSTSNTALSNGNHVDMKSGSSDAVSTPNLSTSTLPSEYSDSKNVATPWDSGVELITPAAKNAVAAAPDVDDCSEPMLTRTVRCVSRGSIHYGDNDYVRFGSIHTGMVKLHRAPSIQSQSAISFCNSELDDAESLAETFPEIGEFVE